MTTNLTKQEAHLIAGNGYRLVDAAGKEFYIYGVNSNRIVLFPMLNKFGIKYEQIGTDYHVLCHPLSRLTTEIEGIGVAIVKLAKIAGMPTIGQVCLDTEHGSRFWVETERANYEFYYSNGTFGAYRDNQVMSVSNQQLLFDKMDKWHFETRGFLERGLGKEINLK